MQLAGRVIVDSRRFYDLRTCKITEDNHDLWAVARAGLRQYQKLEKELILSPAISPRARRSLHGNAWYHVAIFEASAAKPQLPKWDDKKLGAASSSRKMDAKSGKYRATESRKGLVEAGRPAFITEDGPGQGKREDRLTSVHNCKWKGQAAFNTIQLISSRISIVFNKATSSNFDTSGKSSNISLIWPTLGLPEFPTNFKGGDPPSRFEISGPTGLNADQSLCPTNYSF